MVMSMTEPQKRNRHPKYKTPFRVKNWREYKQSLRARGDITPSTPGERRSRASAVLKPIYADIAIETALALSLLFNLP